MDTREVTFDCEGQHHTSSTISEIKRFANYYSEELGENYENIAIVPVDTNTIKTNVNYEELNETINSMMEKLQTGKFACKVCGMVDNKDKTHMRNHIEGKHILGVSHECTQCEKYYRS